MHKDDFLKLVKDSGIGHWLLAEACDYTFEWQKWSKEIPYLKFPAQWEVKIMPPFAAAIVRFGVKTCNGDRVSVYLDCYNHLGCFVADDGTPLPYWEVYPASNGDTARFAMNDTSGLIAEIERAINAKNS